MTVWDILVQYHQGFLAGLKVTGALCAIIWSVGLILGAGLGVAAAQWRLWVGLPSRTVGFLLAGTPVLVFLFWLHYPAQSLMHTVIDPFYTAAFTLSILNIFAVADIVRIAVREFPRQYVIAARVSGMTTLQTLRHVQMPIILRQVIPGLLNAQVAMLQMTLFASLISVEEIFRVAQRINAIIYRPVEIYTALAVFFLAICLPLNGLALFLSKRFTRDISYS
jgi:ABC-type amino acid transport system permease subunit